eukprot:8714008-Alexandrium_andersonii.AAC.1
MGVGRFRQLVRAMVVRGCGDVYLRFDISFQVFPHLYVHVCLPECAWGVCAAKCAEFLSTPDALLDPFFGRELKRLLVALPDGDR